MGSIQSNRGFWNRSPFALLSTGLNVLAGHPYHWAWFGAARFKWTKLPVPNASTLLKLVYQLFTIRKAVVMDRQIFSPAGFQIILWLLQRCAYSHVRLCVQMTYSGWHLRCLLSHNASSPYHHAHCARRIITNMYDAPRSVQRRNDHHEFQ